MVAVITGGGLGLGNTSLTQLGQAQGGAASLGQGGDAAYVNAATGNLVLNGVSEGLVFDGLSLNLVRTYNSFGQASARTLALRFVRAIERQALAVPGARIVARCAPEIAAMAVGPAEALKGIVGARFEVVPDPALGRDQWDIAAP